MSVQLKNLRRLGDSGCATRSSSFGILSDFGFRVSGFPRSAFTLVELLIVIAIIAVLASLIFPVSNAVTRAKYRSVARAELGKIQTAIESYKAKNGFYPPDCVPPGSPVPVYNNQLYYELVGTTLDAAGLNYTTKDGASIISSGNLNFAFGISGIVNTTKGGGGDEGTVAITFLKDIKPSQIGQLDKLAGQPRILVCSIPWPVNNPYSPVANKSSTTGLNPWRYVSSNPTNNPSSFDLWVDVIYDGKTNRFSNWREQPQTVGTP